MENLIDEPIECSSEKDSDVDNEDKDKKPRKIIRSAVDLMRLKVEKLMKNPDKPVIIPEQPKEKDYMQAVPTFVRNVMGSSAGAGSGEFHVYRHLRRKEYARQKSIHAKSIREQLDDEYRQKLENNRLASEIKTAKKRAKRLKKKQKSKLRKLQNGTQEIVNKKDTIQENETDENQSDDSEQESNKNKTEESEKPNKLENKITKTDDIDDLENNEKLLDKETDNERLNCDRKNRKESKESPPIENSTTKTQDTAVTNENTTEIDSFESKILVDTPENLSNIPSN